ncbi:MAG: ACP S-malonyltransferase [Pseudomonadota bacterium]
MTTAVVICPGRGTYSAPELGYLTRAGLDPDVLAGFEAVRRETGQATLAALDGAERFSAAVHTTGDNASALIFACSAADFLALGDVDVVAVSGNSMGWYTALACAGAVSWDDGFRLANAMGARMHAGAEGGQIVYPWMDADWTPKSGKAELLALIEGIAGLSISIDLGGMLVVAGEDAALDAFEAAVAPTGDRFPMRLRHHAAFHSPLMAPVAASAAREVALTGWQQPSLPLIDGRGHTWWPHASSLDALRDYTLGHQITAPYDFTAAIRTAAREFAPDHFVVLGPGTTLGGAVAQSLICANWLGMDSKAAFERVQEKRALLLAMGRADQRALVAG